MDASQNSPARWLRTLPSGRPARTTREHDVAATPSNTPSRRFWDVVSNESVDGSHGIERWLGGRESAKSLCGRMRLFADSRQLLPIAAVSATLFLRFFAAVCRCLRVSLSPMSLRMSLVLKTCEELPTEISVKRIKMVRAARIRHVVPAAELRGFLREAHDVQRQQRYCTTEPTSP